MEAMMRVVLLSSAAALLLSVATPARAATFVNVGDSRTVTFNGTEVGTSSNLLLTLTGENNALNTFTFSYTLNNTSSTALNPSVRVMSFGFNDNQASTPSGSATGTLSSISFNENFPNGIGIRDVCVNAGNCLGGSSGVAVGTPGTGTFTLDYAGSGLTQITLDSFVVRYISTGANGAGSGTGLGTEVPAVPEPSTWALMLLGFGVIGTALRRGRRVQQIA
jgi:hypothetical protein